MEYWLKYTSSYKICKLFSTGKTNLFYLPKYFRKVKRERKAEQKRGRKRQFNSTGPSFLWMPPEFLNN
jgi:hypothetical protein